jgi:hypothetical protein
LQRCGVGAVDLGRGGCDGSTHWTGDEAWAAGSGLRGGDWGGKVETGDGRSRRRGDDRRWCQDGGHRRRRRSLDGGNQRKRKWELQAHRPFAELLECGGEWCTRRQRSRSNSPLVSTELLYHFLTTSAEYTHFEEICIYPIRSKITKTNHKLT